MEDWQLGKNITEADTFLINNEILSDVTFLFEDAEKKYSEIYSHTFMLSKRSSVFYTMFHGSLKECKQVIIRDATKDNFLVFLKFLYTDMTDLSIDNVVEISYLAKKYFITKLNADCCTFTKTHLNVLNVISILTNSICLGASEIDLICMEFISKNTLEVINSENFNDLSINAIKRILELDKVNCEEILIFRQVLKWADNTCYPRSELQDVFKLIRYSGMTGSEFSECAHYSDLFKSYSEIGQIFVEITKSKDLDAAVEPLSKKQKTSDLVLKPRRKILYEKLGFFILLNEKKIDVKANHLCRIKVLALNNFYMTGFDVMAGVSANCRVLNDNNGEICKVTNVNFEKRVYMEKNRIYTFVFDVANTFCYPNIKLGKIFESNGSDIFVVVMAEANVIKKFCVEA